ncbi:MAG TPA: LPS assembly lipoprotein LptE [Geobacteraceae bacterium]|nr:LPS assembly lipoprotein LptE [Geobacteraceae bacterium]
MQRLSIVILSAIVLGMISGCGYTLAGRESGLIREHKISVSMFANRSYQPGIEGKLRLALVSELAAGGNQVEASDTDFVITGEIESLLLEAAAFSAADKAMLYRAVMTVNMQLAEKANGKVIWKSSETVRQEYPSSADLALQRNARDAALSSLCEKMARIVVNRMNQAF